MAPYTTTTPIPHIRQALQFFACMPGAIWTINTLHLPWHLKIPGHTIYMALAERCLNLKVVYIF